MEGKGRGAEGRGAEGGDGGRAAAERRRQRQRQRRSDLSACVGRRGEAERDGGEGGKRVTGRKKG